MAKRGSTLDMTPGRQRWIDLVAVGTHGDVLPMLALGAALVKRGHAVRLAAPPPFAELARRAGIPFHPLGTPEDFERFASAHTLWHPRRGVRPLFDYVATLTEPTYRWLESADPADRGVVVASTLSLGARIAQEKLGLRLVSFHLMPFLLESRHAPPRLPGLPMSTMVPAPLRHLANLAADRYFLAPVALPPLNAFRVSLDLAPVRRLSRWWHSPDRVLLGFPTWYAPRQRDWPAQAAQIGFPLSDRHGDEDDLDPALVAFLDAGPPPLVFSYGSAMRQARRFFATAASLCERMHRRGVFLAPQTGQVPDPLPDGVVHVHYAPLSRLLPRAAALIHHGGIGTVAQALAAGVPQLIVPVAFDHADEARRITKLNAGTSIKRGRFEPTYAARVLERLLNSRKTATACRLVKSRMASENGIDEACRLVEQVLA